MSLTEDPWRPSAGRDHILCGAFKKRPLGGTGHIRVLAHFPEGQKIIRCTEPNSTNPIHNYTYSSNKLCHSPRKWNYYIETLINNNKIKPLRGIMAKMPPPPSPGQRHVAQNFILFLPSVMFKDWSYYQQDLFIQGRICVWAFLAHSRSIYNDPDRY